jgi:hypothetical protein
MLSIKRLRVEMRIIVIDLELLLDGNVQIADTLAMDIKREELVVGPNGDGAHPLIHELSDGLDNSPTGRRLETLRDGAELIHGPTGVRGADLADEV